MICLPTLSSDQPQDARLHGTLAPIAINSQYFDIKIDNYPPEYDTKVIAPASNNWVFDQDLQASSLDLSALQIDHLLDFGSLAVEVGGQQLELSLVGYAQRAGSEHIRLTSFDGTQTLPSTITRRGNTFFATLATSNEVWRIDNRAGPSQALRHSQVSSTRTLYEKDFIHAPHPHQ